MIAGGGGAAEGWVGAAVLRLLLAPAFARNLRVAAAQGRVEVPTGMADIG